MFSYLLIVVITIIFGEVTSYWHHRLFGHKINQLPRETHRHHHVLWQKQGRVLSTHRAYEDFVWVFGALILLGLSLSWFKPGTHVYFTLMLFFVFSLYKAWVHAAYHTPDHFLNKYQFFQRWKMLHHLHHLDSSCNYSLSWFKVDQWFGTFRENVTNHI